MINFEANIVGSLILDNSAITTVGTIINPGDFQNSDYSEIFRCMLEMSDRSAPCDVFTLSDALLNNKYKVCLGITELSDLLENTASAANVEHHAEQVKDQSLKRKVKSISHLAEDCESGAEAVEQAIQELTTVGCLNNKTNFHINDALTSVIDRVEGIFNNTTQFIKSGLEQLDILIHGFSGGGLYVVAARPGMGKSVLALNIATKTAMDGIHTKVFSLEMPKDEVCYRMICCSANLNTRAQYNMQEEDWGKLTAGFNLLKDTCLEIDDGTGYTVGYLKNAIRTHSQKNGKGLYIIDYLQLIRIKGENRVTGIGEITRELKGLAKEIDSPIILLSQLNRGLEQRSDKRPVMADLRESGEIEQDADVIIMVYRDEVYNEQTESKGIAELIVRKNRQGALGTAYVGSALQHAKFQNLNVQSLKQ